MKKIALRYVGKDEALAAKLKKTNGLQMFEPVDAREVLAAEGTEYEYHQEDQTNVSSGPVPTAQRPMTTMGKPIEQKNTLNPNNPTSNPSEGKTVDELKAALLERSIPFPSDARRAELAELYDRNVRG